MMTASDTHVPAWTPDIPGVRAARRITAAAELAASAWTQEEDPAAIAAAAGHLQAGLAGVAAALRAMTDYEPGPVPDGGRYTSPWEPCIYLHCAARAIGYAASDMREACCEIPAAAPATPAVTAAAQLASAAAEAAAIIGRPSGTAQARDEAVISFMHVTVQLGSAAAALASQAGYPLAGLLTRQRARLEQARICLREALAASACNQDDAASLAIARDVRSRHPDMPAHADAGRADR
jgi:hypothetical protein